MRAALTIAWRDTRSAFESPLAFVLIAAFVLVSGIAFHFWLMSFSSFSGALRAAAVAAGDPGMSARLSLDRAVVSPLLRTLCALLLGLIPLLTMRAMAEERRQGTMELLMTAPVTSASIIAGKFLGAWAIACAALALTIAQPLTLTAVAAPDIGPLVAGYCGLFLVAAAMTALGILASALTSSPVVAAFLGYAFIIAAVLGGVFGGMTEQNWGIVLVWFSPLVHFDALAEGLLDIADLAYYAIFTFAALFLAHRVLDSERWR